MGTQIASLIHGFLSSLIYSITMALRSPEFSFSLFSSNMNEFMVTVQLSHDVRKQTIKFLNRTDTNRPVQSPRRWLEAGESIGIVLSM